MGEVTIRDLDDQVIASFAARAAEAGRSLEAEMRAALEQAAGRRDRAALIEEVNRIAARIGPMPPDWPGSTALIREDRDSR